MNVVSNGDATAYLVESPERGTKGRRGGLSWLDVTAADHFSKPRLEERLREMPLPAPAQLADTWLLEEGTKADFIGRPCIRARARRTDHSTEFLWDYVQTLDLVVDQERGVLLRCAALLGEIEAAVLEVRSISFDEPIADSVFRVD